jgi:Protein of unknown function (DUF2811)
MENDVCLMIELPNSLHQEALQFLDQDPEWDQARLFKAALSLFLMQRSGARGRVASRTYLDTMFGVAA